MEYRRIRLQELFGDTHAPDVERHEPGGFVGAEHELRRAPTDVDDEERSGRVEVGGGTEEGELRLLLAGEQLGCHAERVVRAREELVAVARVARGRCRSRAYALDSVLVERGPVLAQYVDGARDGFRCEYARAVDTLTQARDAHAPVERAQLRVAPVSVDVGDEQAHGIGPDVDGREPGHSALAPGFGVVWSLYELPGNAKTEWTQAPTGSSPPAR